MSDSVKRSGREEGDKTPDSSFTTSVVTRPVEKRGKAGGPKTAGARAKPN